MVLLRLHVGELAGICLRAGGPAIEVDVVRRLAIGASAAFLGLGGDLDGRGRRFVELEELWLAVNRNHPIAIAGLRFDRVVAPLEGLDGMLGCGERSAGRDAFVLELESLDAAEKVALDDGSIVELAALDGEAEQSFVLRLL